jgi:hypothetical protein
MHKLLEKLPKTDVNLQLLENKLAINPWKFVLKYASFENAIV